MVTVMLLLNGLHRLNNFLRLVAISGSMLIIAFAVIAMAGSAITRNITGTGYGWLIELPPMLLPWVVFPLLGPLLRAGSHISVDVAPAFLGPKGNQILRIFISLVALAGSIVFLLAGVDAVTLFRNMGQLAELEFTFPIWFIYLAFPVGFAMLASFSTEILFANIIGKAPQGDGMIGDIE